MDEFIATIFGSVVAVECGGSNRPARLRTYMIAPIGLDLLRPVQIGNKDQIQRISDQDDIG